MATTTCPGGPFDDFAEDGIPCVGIMVCGARNEIEKPAGGIHPHPLVEGESMGRVLFFDEGDLAFLPVPTRRVV